ncbi:MAG: cysteine desulfurase [Hyphomicrobiales bacterium]|nr:cysteine desulfurase [Hyphomicrobiales bacterium]
MSRRYLDHNATAPLRPQAREAMLAALGQTGNASSIHAEGRAARAVIENARADVAALVGAPARNVIFTSGATEALALALRPHWRRGAAPAPQRLVIGATEHPAVFAAHEFAQAQENPVDARGLFDAAALDQALAPGQGAAMLALQAANSETGVLQPLGGVGERVRAAGGLMVCDAVQAAGRTPCDFIATGADFLILSSHKIGGPQGAGALILSDLALACDRPLLRGGGQERGLRGGTENVAAIAGFGAAARAALAGQATETARLGELRDLFERGLRDAAPDTVIFGEGAPRLPNTSAFAIPGVAAEKMLIALDLAGVALSSGSACSSGKVRGSHVLAAMRTPENLASCALRASFGWDSAREDAEMAVAAISRAISRLRRG